MPGALDAQMTSLGDYLGEAGYGQPFQDDHILPQAAAIWSASIEAVRELPGADFIRLFEYHVLLKVLNKPLGRTVGGGSRGLCGETDGGGEVRGAAGTGRDRDLAYAGRRAGARRHRPH